MIAGQDFRPCCAVPHGAADAPRPFAGDQRRTAAAKRVEDDGVPLRGVADEVAQHLDRLHGRVDVVLLGLVADLDSAST